MKTKIILFFFYMLINFSLSAQNYVTIPDANFVTWLQTNYPNCMNGNQMDTTCSSFSLNFDQANLSFLNINNLTGIKYLKNIAYLDCSNNNLTFLPELQPNLIGLYCSGNQINEISTLNPVLRYLYCAANQITNISNLPSSLEELRCDNNKLNGLPLLPENLKILNCVGNQITNLPALPNSLSELHCGNNELTSLPDLPLSLSILYCNNNQISNLPDLPTHLNSLNCGNNEITIFPNLPNFIEFLFCNNNQITSIDSLPNSLIKLDCNNNQLTSLPTLPNALNSLICFNNFIDSLPNLPTFDFDYLDCSSNLLRRLPNLPNSLNKLYCSSNLLDSLPILPYFLQRLSCSNNNLNSLPILPMNLYHLVCNNNFITSLPELPPSLDWLFCNNNLLDSLPTLPNELYELSCNSNSITNLPILPATLNSLYCDSNLLTNLPTLPNLITQLSCQNNLITNLSILPTNLITFKCSFNQIRCFPLFPNSILDSNFNISNNPFTCLPNYISAMDQATLLFPLCVDNDDLNNPFNCNSASGLVGSVFLDSNFSCTLDNLENKLGNITFKLYNSSDSLVSETNSLSNGIFQFYESNGTFNLKIDTLNKPYSIQCQGLDTTVTLNFQNQLIDSVNFALNCKAGFDIGVQSIATNGWVFPGQNHELKILAGDLSQWYNMACASGVSGEVQITVSGPITFLNSISTALTPTVSGNTFTYTISDFGTIDIASAFGLIFKTDTTAQAGDQICISINVTPTNGDNNVSNNTHEYCYQVVNSYDPNMKEVYPVNVEPGFIEYFTYTIHFQNTGSAPAFNIRLLDTLNPNLDLETFQVINYSHDNSIMLKSNMLTFYFPNIMLPDSTTDFEGSKGFIQYRIKPKANLTLGTEIRNTANIYFDFNAPIVTNTTINKFGDDDPDFDFKENEIFIFPNPFSTSATIVFKNSQTDADIKLYNVYGQEVLSIVDFSGDKLKIEGGNLANGVYYLKVINQNEASEIVKLILKD